MEAQSIDEGGAGISGGEAVPSEDGEPKTPWPRRHPRRLAAIVALTTGTISALGLARLIYSPHDGVVFAIGSCEMFAVATAICAYGLFRPAVVLAPHPKAAVLTGAACVPLGIALATMIFLLGDTARGEPTPPFHGLTGVPALLAVMVGAAVLYPLFGSIFTLFVPEIVGALSGYLIWRLARQRSGSERASTG